MTNVIFGTLKAVDLRQVWPNEATAFTPWLAENLAALSKAIGIDLELTRRESPCGDFSLDLLAREVGTGRIVVIENQLGATDHDHLGKLLTYAAGHKASVVVWVAKQLRDEHRQSLDWLNQHTDQETEFFGVVVEVLQIDNSAYAYNFKLVAFPNDWGKSVNPPPTPTPRGEAYRSYFQKLIDTLRERHQFTGARVAQPQAWYSFSSGISGILYGTSFAQGDRVRTELYIDRRDVLINKSIFDALHLQKDNLQRHFKEPLEFERLDDRRASRIAVYRSGSIDSDETELEVIRNWAIDRLLIFKKVFGPTIERCCDDL